MVIRVKWLPLRALGGNWVGINLFGIIIMAETASKEVYWHEKIHTMKMKETWFIGFYLIYILEFLFRMGYYRITRPYKKPEAKQKNLWMYAYKNISFEREAYAMAYEIGYNNAIREPYGWVDYV